MSGALRRLVGLSLVVTWLAAATRTHAQEAPAGTATAQTTSGIAASKAELLSLTSLWKGDRCADGRPRVSDDLLKRMKAVSIEEAWDVLRLEGYENQFAGGWTDAPSRTGRSSGGRSQPLSTQPPRSRRANHEEAARRKGGSARRTPGRSTCSSAGDVYIADGFGKVADGTMIGDNLGNAISARTGTGVVFDAGARDPDGLKQIEGFNAYVRGWDPSFMKNMILSSINRPIRIGHVTVIAGRRHSGKKRRHHRHPRTPCGKGGRHRRNRRSQGRVRPRTAPQRNLHSRADRRSLDRPDQGRFLPVARAAAQQAADRQRADRETALIDSYNFDAVLETAAPSRRGKDRANPLANDCVFARLHHPDADDQLLP